MPATVDLAIYGGDTYRLGLTLYTQIPDPETPDAWVQGPALDLTGCRIAAEIRPARRGSAAIEPPAAAFTLVGTPGSDGRVDLVLTPRSSEALLGVRDPAWDLQVITAAGEVTTYVSGKITMTQDVTALPEDVTP